MNYFFYTTFSQKNTKKPKTDSKRDDFQLFTCFIYGL